MSTNSSILCLRCFQLVTAVKQKTENDLLKSVMKNAEDNSAAASWQDQAESS